MLRPRDVIWWALKSVSEAKARAALSMLGVAISAALVVGILCMTATYNVQAQQIFSRALNPKVIAVVPKGERLLTDADVYAIREIRHVVDVLPVLTLTCEVTGAGGQRVMPVLVTDIRKLHEFIPALHVLSGVEATQPGTVMAGWLAANPPDLPYPFLRPGQAIYVNCFGSSRREVVAGIYAPLGMAILDIDHSIVAPLSAALGIPGGRKYSMLYVLVDSVSHVDYVAKAIRELLGKSFEVIMYKAFLESFKQFTALITGFLVALAAMSTVVAGIGIASTMMMAVQQRAKEIGVLKAVGYTDRQVLLLFLMEAVMVGVLGGVVGVLAGIGAGYVLVRVMMGVSSYQVSLSGVVGALAYSAVVAMMAGLYPAYKAARVEPVRVLRYE